MEQNTDFSINKAENILNVITIILICISIVLISPCFLTKRIERFIIMKPIQVPKVIIQTYNNKKRIPPKVYQNISQYSSGYQHLIFDDKECIQFLQKKVKMLLPIIRL